MKVYIGPYRNYLGPYQLAEKICFWASSDVLGDRPNYVSRFGDWLAERDLLMRVLHWIDDCKKRTVQVKIHEYDAWNADHTLALIALPLLKALQAQPYTSGRVDDEDVPEHLRRPPGQQDYVVDDAWHQRWQYVLNEIIFAFESKHTDWEDAFFTDRGGTFEDIKFDREGHELYQARITNGFRLFGKYYEALWS